jgi:hypothetical protein
MGHPIQGDRLEHQLVVRISLRLNYEVIPRVVLGIAGDSRRYPLLVDIVVRIPFVATRDAAFVTPDESLSIFGAGELINIELEGLRIIDVRRVEVKIVDEIMGVIRDGVASVGQTNR